MSRKNGNIRVCPKCGMEQGRVIDTRINRETHILQRRRECNMCGTRWTTVEVFQSDYIQLFDWISTDDKLPDVYKNPSRKFEDVVVIAYNGKQVCPMRYERAEVRGKAVTRWKWVWDSIYEGPKITHWKPLPPPPH